MKIAILAYNDCLASELFSFHDVLALGGQMARATGESGARSRRLQVSIVTATSREITTSGGARVTPNSTWKGADLLIAPGFSLFGDVSLDQRLAGLAPEITLLAESYREGVSLASICVGAFLLGEAGVLNDRKATTAWLFAEDLARRNPRAQIDRFALMVEDRGVTTTGAFTASHDLALHLVGRHLGQAAARATRNVALIESGRESQRPFLDLQLISRPTSTFATRVENWLKDRLDEPYDLKALAHGVAASGRTLLRRYRAERGRTPLAFLQIERIQQAQRLIETNQLSIAEISHRVGYHDVSAFRTLFARHAGIPPGAYRKRFSGPPSKNGDIPNQIGDNVTRNPAAEGGISADT